MAVFSVEGKLGTGKTKFAVWRAQQAMWEGRPVASNVDLQAHLLAPRLRARYIRIPDKPSATDLEAMGHGNPDSYEEDRNGVLILDELGTWLNARAFQDKNRAPLLDWLIHARKHGWDVYLIVQDAGMIDKQVREALIEYQVKCLRMDKVMIPVVGRFLKAIYRPLGYLPRFHLAAARVAGIVAERWTFTGKHLHACYDTRQVFRSDYPHGAHSVLPPWDWKPVEGWLARLRAWFAVTRPVARPVAPRSRALQLIAMLPDAHERVRLARRWLQACEVAARLPVMSSIDKQGGCL